MYTQLAEITFHRSKRAELAFLYRKHALEKENVISKTPIILELGLIEETDRRLETKSVKTFASKGHKPQILNVIMYHANYLSCFNARFR